VAVVAGNSYPAPDLDHLNDAQATSDVVTLIRLPWTLTLTTDITTFSTTEQPTLTATANHDVGPTGGAYKIYILDIALLRDDGTVRVRGGNDDQQGQRPGWGWDNTGPAWGTLDGA
jgi:hypothetical protein